MGSFHNRINTVNHEISYAIIESSWLCDDGHTGVGADVWMLTHSGLILKLQTLTMIEELFQYNHSLRTNGSHAHTVVDATAEAQVPIRLPRHIQFVRISELSLVTIS